MAEYDWHPVESSMMRAVCFNGNAMPVPLRAPPRVTLVQLGTMYVCFASGDVYRYERVHRDVFEAIRDAESPGRAYNLLIPNGSGTFVAKLKEEEHADEGK